MLGLLDHYIICFAFCHSRESGNPEKMLDARLKRAGMTQVKVKILNRYDTFLSEN